MSPRRCRAELGSAEATWKRFLSLQVRYPTHPYASDTVCVTQSTRDMRPRQGLIREAYAAAPGMPFPGTFDGSQMCIAPAPSRLDQPPGADRKVLRLQSQESQLWPGAILIGSGQKPSPGTSEVNESSLLADNRIRLRVGLFCPWPRWRLYAQRTCTIYSCDQVSLLTPIDHRISLNWRMTF
jgi:hypothetical protein